MVSLPLCQIWMISPESEKLFLKVERGAKPRLRLFEDSRKALVTIPNDQATKWPALKAKMSGGLTIVVQRLEQQYKITVQHMLERKPDVCVYVNAMAHERDIKTSIREMNTQLSHVGVAGPNLEITGRIRASKVTFESTVGALHTNAKLDARSVTLNAQNIFIKPEALYSCTKIRMVSRRVQIDGKIYPRECDSRCMSVFVDSALLHIGVDGAIGSIKSSKDVLALKATELTADVLVLRVCGSLANFGRISSRSGMEFRVDGSVLSLKDGRIDSAARGYTALKQIKGIVSDASASLPTSNKLSTAIVSQNPDIVAQLLEDGVDPNDSIVQEKTTCTPKRIAAKKYREIRTAERRNKLREKITVIQALMNTHDWRRGLITSETISAKIGRDCADCAQFRATNLHLTAHGTAKCETDSIWTSSSVILNVDNDLIFEGQVKHQHLDAYCGGSVMTTEDAIVSQEMWAKIRCSAFCNAGIWSVGEQVAVEAQTATFLADSYLEVEHFSANIDGNCHHAGIWQMKFLTVSLGGNLLTLPEGRVLVEETADVKAVTFNCSGAWKISESMLLALKGSSNVFSSGQINSSALKMIVEGHCTVAGHIAADNVLAYIRNDLITASTGRVNIGIGGTVAVGAFRNDAIWVSESNLHLHTACYEQSEDAIMLVKGTLNLAVYDESVERSQGRIFANYCILRVNKRTRFDGYIRVNQIEINLPLLNESRCIIGGQLEVLAGPLILKGRSEFDGSPSYSPHAFPAFVLEGQLKAEAVISPFLATRFSSSSYALLSGMDSVASAPYRTLISTGALYTMRASLIDSVSKDTFPEAIICATTWVHEGQIRFRGDSTYLIVDSFVNTGRLTNDGKLHNHMKEVFVSIANRFNNDAVLSADKIHISGDGELQNKNRIYAKDTMNIRLANFSNESGQMQSDDMKLLSAGKEWTKINGRIEAKGNLDISASKLCMALKNFNLHKQMRISARAQLLVSSEVNNESANVALSARDAIVFDSNINVDVLELTVGASYETEILINPEKSIEANHLRIAGKCKFLTLLIDGNLSCDSVIIEASIKNIKITGTGMLICRKSLNVAGDSAVFSLTELQAADILGTTVALAPNPSPCRLLPIKGVDIVTVYADQCNVQGNILLEGKFNVKASKGIAQISAQIMGSTTDSELSVECEEYMLSGNISNLEFLELYAKKRIEHCDTAVLKNIRSSAIAGGYIAFNGKMINCESVIATAEEIAVQSSFLNDNKGAVCSMFAKTIRFDGTAQGISRLEISGRSDVILNGSFNDIETVEIDAKWVTSGVDLSNCGTVKITSYSCYLDGTCFAGSLTASCVGAIFNSSKIETSKCALSAPFIFSLKAPSPLPTGSLVNALIFAADKPCELISNNRICLNILFDPDAKDAVTTSQMEIWKQTMEMLSESFRSPTISLEEVSTALKYFAETEPANFVFPAASQLHNDMEKILKKFCIDHISVFSCPKLIAAMRAYESHMNVNNLPASPETQDKPRFEPETLFELINRFRLRAEKYASRSPRRSIDDGGYASRSSSEGIDEKSLLADRSTPTFINDNPCPQVILADEICDEMEKEMDENTKSVNFERAMSLSTYEENEDLCCEDTESELENELSFVLNGDHKVSIGFIDFGKLDAVISKPRFNTPMRTASTTDLAMKKIKVKAAISNLDLRSFGSESSLASFSSVDRCTPMRLIASPLKPSLIPRSSYRRPLNLYR